MRMPASHPIALVLLLASLACRETPMPESPFTFFERPDMRAGIQFSLLDDAAKRESIGRFTCKDLWAGGKRCQMIIDPGMMIATVNGKGRVIHFKVATDKRLLGAQWDPRSEKRVDFAKAEFIKMREAWNLVNDAEVTVPARGAATFKWVDNQSRWTAGMWYGSRYGYLPEHWRSDMPHYQDSLAPLPDSVVTVDEFALEDYLAQQPTVKNSKAPPKGPPTTPLERMQFDLTMVASAQAEYFEDKATFATAPDRLLFLAGDGVRITIVEATNAGWSASATHDALPGIVCVLYSGTVASPPRTPKGMVPGADTVACDASD
jgi:hypothetical protein